MTKEIRIMTLRNRIDLLTGRADRENGKIVAKLKRQLRNLEKN